MEIDQTKTFCVFQIQSSGKEWTYNKWWVEVILLRCVFPSSEFFVLCLSRESEWIEDGVDGGMLLIFCVLKCKVWRINENSLSNLIVVIGFSFFSLLNIAFFSFCNTKPFACASLTIWYVSPLCHRVPHSTTLLLSLIFGPSDGSSLPFFLSFLLLLAVTWLFS